MSGSLRLNGSTSGFSEITAPAVAGDQTFTLPAVGGNLVVYQQGIWTPTSTLGTVVGTEPQWARVGNLINLFVKLSDFSEMSDTTTRVGVAGIPYPTATSYGAAGSAFMAEGGEFTVVYITKDGNIEFYDSSANAFKSMKYSDVSSGISLYLQASYLTNDTTFVPTNGATIS